jgi:hypothetical protein
VGDLDRVVHPFLDLFDIQVFSFETEQLKREAFTLGALLETIGRSAEACLLVDDSPLDG